MDFISGIAAGSAGPIIVQALMWLARRDRQRIDADQESIRAEQSELWLALEDVKREQASLRERVAGLPNREELQRLEERLEKKIDDLGMRILDALSSNLAGIRA